MSQMRAIDIEGGKGPASALFINKNTPRPTAHGNQALIKVKAFGLNRTVNIGRGILRRAIFVTASSQDKIDFCKSVGATEGFKYKQGDWAEELLKFTDRKGADLIIDVVGAGYFNQNIDAVATDGHIVSLGTLGGAVVHQPVDVSRFLKKRIRFEGSTLRARSQEYQGKLRDRLVELVLPKFINGTFKVYLEKVFDWRDVQAAHSLLVANETKGKVICLVS